MYCISATPQARVNTVKVNTGENRYVQAAYSFSAAMLASSLRSLLASVIWPTMC